MLIKIIALLSLLLLVASQPNYQEGNVYYNESENCCRYGGDNINLIINLNDQDRIKKEMRGGTYCHHCNKSHQNRQQFVRLHDLRRWNSSAFWQQAGHRSC